LQLRREFNGLPLALLSGVSTCYKMIQLITDVEIAARGLVLHTRDNKSNEPHQMVLASSIAGGVGGSVGGLLSTLFFDKFIHDV
jgi:hypothetical protein